jgi:glycosyltransferase involved in cell wall biosynthesis
MENLELASEDIMRQAADYAARFGEAESLLFLVPPEASLQAARGLLPNVRVEGLGLPLTDIRDSRVIVLVNNDLSPDALQSYLVALHGATHGKAVPLILASLHLRQEGEVLAGKRLATQMLAKTSGWYEIESASVSNLEGLSHEDVARREWAKWNAPNLVNTGDYMRDLCVLLPGPKPLPEKEHQRPFLSVITRTQGKRLGTLMDMLLCFGAQSREDFEIIVVCHKVPAGERAKVEALIDALPNELRKKVTVEGLDHGNRTAPLNFGFALAKGSYIAIMDDDDLVFDNWVEVFGDLATQHPGRVLRAVTLRQDCEEIQTPDGYRAARPIGPMERTYDSEFNAIDHLLMNRSPPACLAFPRTSYHNLGIRFDETLTTMEDYDYLMRVSACCGVASSPEITSIYRWWKVGASSRSDHNKAEWDANLRHICAKLDSAPLLLPAGSFGHIRNLLKEMRRRSIRDIHKMEVETLRILLASIYASTSWKISKPIRFFGAMRGKPNPPELDPNMLNEDQLRHAIQDLFRSRSWRSTNHLRRVLGVLKGKPPADFVYEDEDEEEIVT